MISAIEKYRRWSKGDYLRMAETGILANGERTELFEGIILTVSPNNPPHANSVSVLTRLLGQHFPNHIVRVQLPLDIDGDSLPEPDLAVITEDQLSPERHPSKAELVVEVADSSLAFDRHQKSSLYARSGIEDYWVVNVKDRVLEVYREPAKDSEAHLGWSYRRRVVLEAGESVSPLARPGELAVGSMF